MGGGGMGGAIGGGGGLGGASGGGPGGSVGRGSRWGNLGGTCLKGQALVSQRLPSPPSNHTITPNLTLTFAASWFGHASHVD